MFLPGFVSCTRSSRHCFKSPLASDLIVYVCMYVCMQCGHWSIAIELIELYDFLYIVGVIWTESCRISSKVTWLYYVCISYYRKREGSWSKVPGLGILPGRSVWEGIKSKNFNKRVDFMIFACKIKKKIQCTYVLYYFFYSISIQVYVSSGRR